MDVLAALDETRAAIDVLEHPFYQRWIAGELGAGRAGLLRRRVSPCSIALAEASASVAPRRARAPRAARAPARRRGGAHVELWEQFAARLRRAEPRRPRALAR